MSAAAEIVTSSVENALLIPNRAVRTVSGEQEVYILRNGIPTRVTITLGKSSDTDSELVEGDVKEGDLIVLNPSSLPQNGPEFGPGNQGGGGPFGGGDQP
jgi:HlyD family secretion protein